MRCCRSWDSGFASASVWECRSTPVDVGAGGFPLVNAWIALAGTLALALLVLPLRRAVRSGPGDALRYA